jgi:hypothetical protein
MARTRRGRLRQVENWLNDKFPPPRPTLVKLFDLKRGKRDCPDAITFRKGRRIFILIHSKLSGGESVLCLIEEWAHARTWGLVQSEKVAKDHGPEWGIAHAEIKSAYFDENGWKESRDYAED